MSSYGVNSDNDPLVSVSWWDRLNASALLAITPEYRGIKRAQAAGFGSKPTFDRLPPMPLAYKVIAGVKVRYAHAGSPDRPTVILLNPLPQSIVAFAPVWERLASRFNLYAYDLPGFGGSDGGVDYMTFESQGRFLRDFITEFSIKRPHLVGPDIGMAAILAYATQQPNEVESIVIGDGPGIAPSANGSIIEKMVNSSFWRSVMKIAGAGAFVHAANQLCYVNYVPTPEEVSDYIRSYSGRIGPVTKWFEQYPESLASIDPKLAELDKPILLFWGRQDQLLLLDNAERLSQRLLRNRLHVFEGCGHFSYQDKHEEFGDLLIEWIDGRYQMV